MDNFNKAPDTSTTGTSTNINYSKEYCANRLPCGYCTRLDRLCPMMGNRIYEPTWKLPDITCGGTSGENK